METKDLRQVDVLKLTAPYCEQYGNKNETNQDISQYCYQEKMNLIQRKTVRFKEKQLNVSESWLMGFDVPMGRNDYEFKDDDWP